MNKSLCLLLTSLLALISCKSQYMVRGSSNVDELEGKMLTLKVYVDGEMKSIDSTRVVHGRFNFGERKTQLDARMAELPHLEAQMIMNGTNDDERMFELSKQSKQLADENDKLITRFIRTNYNNVLGPGIFMILTSNMPYPILTPQIEEIITNAPPYFLGHPYVKEYIKKAKEYQEKAKEY